MNSHNSTVRKTRGRPLQFMPGTWASMGVDGDGDGRADIHNDADSIYSAANYLTKSGVRTGAAGVRRAL
jgi:membrane-bound lytic murein transglycosylase B